ncbi:MAG TPA: hypothetical protein VLR26_12935 [Frankiaceae bacterium]|nr:hypothetical protein [Frankiaceae bacterium]
MGAVVAIGSPDRIAGFALTGVLLRVATDDGAAQRAWDELDGDVSLVILTVDAARAVGPAVAAPHPAGPLTVVLPA